MCFVILIVLALLIFLAVAARQPDEFQITRTATMAATPAAIFPHINDLHKWKAWSPWAKLDPAAKETYEGPAAGPGAIFRWDGNRKVGAGAMTIIDSRPNESVRLRLEFLRPFQATNTAEFTFLPVSDGTAVSWSMNGKNTFISKVMGLIMNCEKMVGGQFDQGLAHIKAIVENSKS